MFFFFFFNDTATTEIYTLSLHDALPISDLETRGLDVGADALTALLTVDAALWRKELAELREYLARFGSRLPAGLLAELESTQRRVGLGRRARAGRPPDSFPGEAAGFRGALSGRGPAARQPLALVLPP